MTVIFRQYFLFIRRWKIDAMGDSHADPVFVGKEGKLEASVGFIFKHCRD